MGPRDPTVSVKCQGVVGQPNFENSTAPQAKNFQVNSITELSERRRRNFFRDRHFPSDLSSPTSRHNMLHGRLWSSMSSELIN